MIIKLNTIKDVKDFVQMALECETNVYIKQNRYTVDGKSILGIFSLDLMEPVQLVIDNDDYSRFEQFKYESDTIKND